MKFYGGSQTISNKMAEELGGKSESSLLKTRFGEFKKIKSWL